MAEKGKSFLNHFLTILFGVAIVLFVWTFSISLPIYVRAFYYTQIDALNIEESSGYDKTTIKEAYDDVLDYLTLHKDFGTGELKCSESAKAHFADCRTLFDINLSVMIVSAVVILTICILAAKHVIELKKYKGFNIWFFSAICALVLPLVFLAVAAINFDTAFVVFHKILFPGKSNWYFDPVQDEIINILPVQYFAHCGILVGCSIFCFCITLIVVEFILRRRKNVVCFFVGDVKEAKINENLPKSVQEHIAQYSSPKRRAESICAWNALEDILNKKFGLKLQDLDLQFSKRDKPIVKNVFISVSHSDEKFAVCASKMPCAIDIEKMEDNRDFSRISQKVFGIAIEGKKEFYMAWTKNEAMAKLFDVGIGSLKDEKLVRFETKEENGYAICIVAKNKFKICECK